MTTKGNNIKRMCVLRGISQKKLAAALDVAPSQISELATGKKAISLKMARTLAEFFHCPLDVFIDGVSGHSADVERLTIELEQERAKSAKLAERVKELEARLANIARISKN